jgi:hypothetical protein
VAIAARVDIRQDVEHNLGRVVGVQTETIHGNVYGGDIYHVQVYALSGTGRAADWRSLLGEDTAPYKYLSPYAARDRLIFKGREAEVEQVIRQVGEQSLVVIYGQAGVGKTSLLAAGVIPALIEYGALVVHVHEYNQPLEKTVHDALTTSADQIAIPPSPDGLPLPALVRTVVDATQGTFILVLDQFERIFEPTVGDEQRTLLTQALSQTLEAIDAELLRLVIVVRDDVLAQLGRLHDPVGLWRSPIPLLPLSRQQAQTAIEAPLAALDFPGGVSYVGDVVPRLLVPDLDVMNPKAPDQILPAHLQIVCHWLHQAARSRRPPHIDEELYRQLKRAEGIMARYVTETLATRLADQQALARHILETIASPALGRVVSSEQLPSNGASAEQVQHVLERLVKAELLVQQAVNGQHKYAFASPIVRQSVRLQAPVEVRRRYQAEDDLERVWAEWLAHEALANRMQLRYLDKAHAYLSPSPVQELLLLRSAVALDVEANSWRARLDTDPGRALIQQLEQPGAPVRTWHADPSALDEAERLLGLCDDALPSRPEEAGESFGPVAWSAVSHPNPVTRQMAALALTVLQPHPQETLDRLRWALATGDSGWWRWRRRVELRGTLADADPEVEKLRADLSLADRGGAWLWRVRRRAFRDRHRIAGLTLGGALGAGLGLGLLRAVIGALVSRLVGVQFAIYFFWAAILGAALALGMALAEPLLLGRSEKTGETPPIWRAPLHPDRLPAALAVGLGMLFFGLAHLTVAWFNGLSLPQAPLVAPMGFVAGLGLAVALYDQPRAGWRLGGKSWLLRLVSVALIYALTQAVFVAARDRGPGIAIAWAGSFYKAEFTRYVSAWWPQMMDPSSRWFDYLALVDAALVGVVLTVGITAGLVLAARWLAWWRSLVSRTEE